MSFGGHNRRFSQATFDTGNDIEISMSTPNRELRSSALGIYGKDKPKKGKNYEPNKISQRGSGITIAGPLGADTRQLMDTKLSKFSRNALEALKPGLS